MSKRVIVYALGAMAIIFVSVSPAKGTPITVDSVGDAFTVTLAGVSDPGSLPVSVQESWLAIAFGPTSVTFQVTMDNTSATSPSRLTSFAFVTEPDAVSGSSTSSIYQHVFMTGGGGDFDVCVENDRNDNCFGNRGNIGLIPSDPVEVFLLTLNFPDTSDGIVFSNFFARLQGIGAEGASAKIFGDPACMGCEITTTDDPPVSAPEPATGLLLGGAFFTFALRRHRCGKRNRS